jgi:hypothetical protein
VKVGWVFEALAAFLLAAFVTAALALAFMLALAEWVDGESVVAELWQQ